MLRPAASLPHQFLFSRTRRANNICRDPTTGVGVCGMGPSYCAPGNCTSECTAKSECDPGWGAQWSQATKCPLNVCCSKFGFCGTTAEFCDGKTVPSPNCPGGKSADQKTIGYYEGWNLDRACGREFELAPDVSTEWTTDEIAGMAPEDIPLGYYTHINFAFALVNPTSFHIEDMAPSTAALYDRVSALKKKDANLKVWIGMLHDP